jgi:hypothetical protein
VSGQDVSDHLRRHPSNDFFGSDPGIHWNNRPFAYNGPFPDNSVHADHGTHADHSKIIDLIAVDYSGPRNLDSVLSYTWE